MIVVVLASLLFVGLIRKLADTSTDDVDSAVVSYPAEQTAQATLWPSDEKLRERFVIAPPSIST